MNITWWELVIAILGSTGLWEAIKLIINHFIQKSDKKSDKLSLEQSALLGLLHDRLFALLNDYLGRESLTVEEYSNLKAMYEPYVALGGNGTIKRMFDQVEKLPLSGTSDIN